MGRRGAASQGWMQVMKLHARQMSVLRRVILGDMMGLKGADEVLTFERGSGFIDSGGTKEGL